MTAPAPFQRPIRAAILAALLCTTAPAALAQAVTTAPAQGSGISQEQALALSARLDALEERKEELEAQISDLKGQTSGASQQIREAQAAQPTVSVSNGRPTIT